MSARSRMTHRALVERDVTITTDPFGSPGTPDWVEHLAELPCWFYVGGTGGASGGEIVLDHRTIVAEALRVLVPKGTDITERDRINGIHDRLGADVYAPVMNIRSVTPHHDHLELQLESVE